MSFVIAAGGTAGHIYPALAVAAELEHMGKKVLFVGSTGGMEERLVAEAGLDYYAFKAKGFDRQKPWTLLSSSLVLAHSANRAQRWLKEMGAEAVGAFGGYVSVPVGRAAIHEKIPLLIHEQNSVMGWTNKYLSKRANVIALTYDIARDELDITSQQRIAVTGNPVRPEFSALADADSAALLRQEFREELGIPAEALVLLTFGGSQGARHINQSVVKLAAELMKRPELVVVHITGRKELESVREHLAAELDEKTRERWHLIGYCNTMPAAFAAADIVLSRAGASSLAETTVAAKPSLLVPYPYATADHQRKNAESLVKAGAAKMVPDSDLEGPLFSQTLLNLIDNAAERAGMSEILKRLQAQNAARLVAELLIALVR